MPTPPVPRSSAAVNEDIRALLRTSRGRLSPEARDRYRRLRSEWAEAVDRERTLAA